MSSPLLRVEDLGVSFATAEGSVRAVDSVSFELRTGEVLAIVGESGAGKSACAMALMGLNRSPGACFSGAAWLGELELLAVPDAALRRVRGTDMALIPQDPLSALNPVQRAGDQVVEAMRAHERVSRRAARERARALMVSVGLPAAAFAAHPHELSGGMRQRVMIAMALSCQPRVLIADEPTTALDVTIQAQVLALLAELRERTGAGILLVTHDLGVVAALADRVAVMYAGRLVETGTVDEVFHDPQHPYTWGLLGSTPGLAGARGERLAAIAGAPPSRLGPDAGCRFRARCPHEHAACAAMPELAERVGPGHADRCWLPVDQKRLRREHGGRIGLEPRGIAA